MRRWFAFLLLGGLLPFEARSQDLRTRLSQVLGPGTEIGIAISALDSGHYSEVERLLDAAREKKLKPEADLLAVRGAVQFVAYDMPGAIASYSAAAKLGPLSDADNFTLAMAFANEGEAGPARVLIQHLGEAHPNAALYVYWLGRLDYYERRYENSAKELRAAAKLDPRSVRVWNSLGLAYDMLGRMADAAIALQKAVELNRQDVRPSAWPPNDLGSLLLRMEKPVEAESILREALKYNPNLIEAHYRLGRALEKLGRDPEAIEEYRTAVSGDRNSAAACYALANILRRLHRESEAELIFKEFERRKQREDAAEIAPLLH